MPITLIEEHLPVIAEVRQLIADGCVSQANRRFDEMARAGGLSRARSRKTRVSNRNARDLLVKALGENAKLPKNGHEVSLTAGSYLRIRNEASALFLVDETK